MLIRQGILLLLDAVERKLGHLYRRAEELEDEPDAPRTAFVSNESIGDAEGGLVGALTYVGAVAMAGAVVASGGSAAAAIAGAALTGGAGALIGGVLAKLVGEQQAETYQEHLDHGGLLLWVRTRDGSHEGKALDILARHSGRDVHLHALPQGGG